MNHRRASSWTGLGSRARQAAPRVRPFCVALTGLGSLVAGLRGHQPRWRELGLTAIAVAGCKVVLIDLARRRWRALAFMGIGAVLIAGAMAYSRAQQRRVQAQAQA